MAITFEQKRNIGKPIVATILALGLLGAAGFFIWKVYTQGAEENLDEVKPPQVTLDYRALNDERIVSMELFPDIPPAEKANVGKKNPFAENDATTTATIDEAGRGNDNSALETISGD